MNEFKIVDVIRNYWIYKDTIEFKTGALTMMVVFIMSAFVVLGSIFFFKEDKITNELKSDAELVCLEHGMQMRIAKYSKAFFCENTSKQVFLIRDGKLFSKD